MSEKPLPYPASPDGTFLDIMQAQGFSKGSIIYHVLRYYVTVSLVCGSVSVYCYDVMIYISWLGEVGLGVDVSAALFSFTPPPALCCPLIIASLALKSRRILIPFRMRTL